MHEREKITVCNDKEKTKVMSVDGVAINTMLRLKVMRRMMLMPLMMLLPMLQKQYDHDNIREAS